MAIYHLSVKIIGRSSGRSAVGAAAYRSAQKLVNERDGITHDYNRKGGIVEEGSFILAPEHAPGWTKDRGQLWNEVEKVEKQKDAQLSREFEIALPAELTREQQIDLGRDFAQELVKMGMVVDGNLHDKNDGNPHYHFMATMRPFNSDGSGWGAKCRKEYMLNKEGEKIRLKSGQWKSRKISTTDWDTPETLEKWRKTWATIGNKHLEAAGHEPTLDHRSNADRGIEELPTVHLGVESHAMEKRGIQTELGNINRERTEYNKALNLKTEDITEKINQLEVLAIEAIPFYKPGHKEWKKAVENLMTDVVQPEPAVKPIFDRGEVFKAKEIGKVAEVKKEQQEAVAMTTTHPVSEWTGIIKNNKEKYKKQATQLENTRVLLNNQLQNSYALFLKQAAESYFANNLQKNLSENDSKLVQLEKDREANSKTGLFKRIFNGNKVNADVQNIINRQANVNRERTEIINNHAKKIADIVKNNYPDAETKKDIIKTAMALAVKADPTYPVKIKTLQEKLAEIGVQKSTLAQKATKNDNLGHVLQKKNPAQLLTLPTLPLSLGDSKAATLVAKTDSGSDTIDWDMLTPSEIQTKMAELKQNKVDHGMGL